MHTKIEPPILYFGTPVVLIGTVNADGSRNLAPMSSAFWLGWRCILGLGAASKTTENLLRTGECTLNLPSVDQVAAVDRLALTTGTDPVPAAKNQRGYRFEPAKFATADLTETPSETIKAPVSENAPCNWKPSWKPSTRSRKTMQRRAAGSSCSKSASNAAMPTPRS